jgi:hypothetical protein
MGRALHFGDKLHRVSDVMAYGRVVDRVVNLVMWEKCVRVVASKWTIPHDGENN